MEDLRHYVAIANNYRLLLIPTSNTPTVFWAFGQKYILSDKSVKNHQQSFPPEAIHLWILHLCSEVQS